MTASRSTRADLVLHPVRMRILQAFLGGSAGRQLTARELAREMPDVPHATLYRHLKRLVDGGILTIVAERPVRGATQKVYALPLESAILDDADLATRSRQDLLRDFTTFLGVLLHDYAAYLARADVDPRRDGVIYRGFAVYADDEEFVRLQATVNTALLPFVGARPAPGRRRRLLTAIAMPAPDGPESGGTHAVEDMP